MVNLVVVNKVARKGEVGVVVGKHEKNVFVGDNAV